MTHTGSVHVATGKLTKHSEVELSSPHMERGEEGRSILPLDQDSTPNHRLSQATKMVKSTLE